MSNEISIYDPRTMNKIIKKLPPTRTFFRDTFFKHEETFATKSVDVDFVKGSRKVAPFVSRVIGGKIVSNTGYETRTYTPPLVAPEKMTTIDDLLKRRAGENIYSGKTPEQRAVDKMAQDFIELQEMIVRREEWMCVQTIFTGKIPIIGDGVNETIDFNFTNKKKITKTTEKWTDEASEPVENLKQWHETVQKTGFVNCDMCVMGKSAVNAFVNHPKVRNVLDVKNYNLAIIQPQQLPNGVTYIGTIHEIGMDIYKYNEWYLDDWTNPEQAEDKPLIPENHIALLSSKANYSMCYGAITLIDESGNFRTVEGKRVPDVWAERKPARRFIGLASAPLSVPHDVDSWFVAEVL